MKRKILQCILGIGALFFFFEALLHFFGLPILEHDRIFLFTHDRYIALFALTYGFMLLTGAMNPEKNYFLIFIALIGIFLSFLNAWWISRAGGYEMVFPVVDLDQKLTRLGYGAVIWYISVLYLVAKVINRPFFSAVWSLLKK